MFVFLIVVFSTKPMFEDYLYTYYTSADHSGFSQLQYSIIKLGTVVGSLIGIAAYNLFLKQASIRTVIIISEILFIF